MLNAGERRKRSIKSTTRIKKAKRHHDKVGLQAGKVLKENSIRLKKTYHAKPPYAGPRVIVFNNDCSLLQNLHIMRRYLYYKYDVDINLLELLLYLYPFNYFTGYDYHDFPMNFKFARLKNMVECGHIVIASDVKKGKKLYALSLNSKKIVRKFYALLSGEETIPESDFDKAWNKTETAKGNKTFDLIKKMSKLPPSESKKKLYD